MTENEISGRTAVVTGSTSGIGLEIAKSLAKHDANVVLNGLGVRAEIDAITDELHSLGDGNVSFCDADMRQPNQITAMIEWAVDHYRTVDILINNAGIQHVSPIQEFPVNKWDEILAVNLSSAFHTIRAAVPHMICHNRGRIINIASVHALVASPFKSAYVAAKHGIAGLTKSVALEVAQSNITVNAIAPGYVRTPLVDGQIADTAKIRGISEESVVREIIHAAQPTKRLVRIEEVCALALFLCGESASSITGAVLPIDGGWSAV